VLDLAVEIESFPREMSASIQQYQVVGAGSPQRSRSAKIFGSLHLDAVTAQNIGANVTSALVGVDEQNFLVIENRATPKWWWLVHPAQPRLARVGEGNTWPDSPPGRGASQEKWKGRCPGTKIVKNDVIVLVTACLSDKFTGEHLPGVA
jgi:hypothetical protein